MIAQPHEPDLQAHKAPDDLEEPRLAVVDRYRTSAAQHLRDSATMANLAAAMLEGSRDGTVDEFCSVTRAHEMLTREAGSALACLGAVVDCEGIA